MTVETMNEVRVGFKFQDTRTGDLMEVVRIKYFAPHNELDEIFYNWLTGNHQPMDGYYMFRESFDYERNNGILIDAA